jgi:predicted HTH transcriptional regulator
METLDALSETLDTELKGWLNLSEPREAALFAKTCLALRNNDGGRIILGIDDSSCNSIPTDEPIDLSNAFHVDKINEVVGRFAIPKFEVRVNLKLYQGIVHPEIVIPTGIQNPVISRTGFEKELRQNAVYVRTISNGRPSSCEPMTAADWDKLMRICFDNREADVGRFLRRHLPDMVVQLEAMRQAGGRSEPLNIQPERAAHEFLEFGWNRLKSRWTEKYGSPKS